MGEKADSRAFLSARRSRRSSCQAGSAIRGMLGLVSWAETVGPVVGGDHDDLVSGARRRWSPRCVKKETDTQKRDQGIVFGLRGVLYCGFTQDHHLIIRFLHPA